MSQELSKKMKCALLIGGLEIWLEEDRAALLESLMESHKFVKLDDSTIAVSQIAGVFPSQQMDEFKRLKQGQWKCMRGNEWHDKGEKCKCEDFRLRKLCAQMAEVQKKCGICKDGYKEVIEEVNNHESLITVLCECSQDFIKKIAILKKENGDE